MLALLVSTEPGAGATETIDNLKEIKAIIAEFKSVRQQRIATCDICVINGGEPENCDYLVTCRKMKVLESRRESAQNLGLLGRVRDYNQFLNAKPKSKTHLEYLDYFRRLIHTDNLGDLAIARMKAVLTLALTEGQIESKPHTEPPRRAATMPSYFLPVEPYVPNPVHRELVRMIFSYPNVALRDMISAKQLLRDALERFEVLDRETDRPDPYHELVRCLMYMAEREISRNTARGDANALEYAKKMASTHPELKAEFLYVITWTARRLDKFQEAHNAAKQGISEYPDDPRFFHGRSVNTFLWLDNDKQRKYCPTSLADAVADAEVAFELYSKHPEDRAAVMAIQLNNIAWARCADPKSPLYDLSGSRSALDRLKAVLPPAEWLPRFPSFLHTEASVELAESDMAVNRGADPSLVLSKLERARKAIKEAVNAGDGQAGQPYAAFKDKIERRIERLEKKVTGR